MGIQRKNNLRKPAMQKYLWIVILVANQKILLTNFKGPTWTRNYLPSGIIKFHYTSVCNFRSVKKISDKC